MLVGPLDVVEDVGGLRAFGDGAGRTLGRERGRLLGLGRGLLLAGGAVGRLDVGAVGVEGGLLGLDRRHAGLFEFPAGPVEFGRPLALDEQLFDFVVVIFHSGIIPKFQEKVKVQSKTGSRTTGVLRIRLTMASRNDSAVTSEYLST